MSVKNVLPYQGAREMADLKRQQAAVTNVRMLLPPSHSVTGGLPQPRYTRIDFFRVNVGIERGAKEPVWGWRVLKYIDGWTAHTPPHVVTDDPPIKSADGREQPFDLDTALQHLKTRGWTIHRWPTGARAWLGAPLPVRDRSQIGRFRAALTKHLWATHGHTDMTTQVDLAFDY
jgi:hypothetical protein